MEKEEGLPFSFCLQKQTLMIICRLCNYMVWVALEQGKLWWVPTLAATEKPFPTCRILKGVSVSPLYRAQDTCSHARTERVIRADLFGLSLSMEPTYHDNNKRVRIIRAINPFCSSKEGFSYKRRG